MLKTWISNTVHTQRKTLENIGKQVNQTLTKIKEPAIRILPPVTVEMSNMKDEVWVDLSRIYYKYEDTTQKQAFREVVLEMSDKINDGRWETVYKKLYRIENPYIT